MGERPVVTADQRVPAPAGSRRMPRLLAWGAGVLAAGTLADWAYGGFVDGLRLATGIGFALMVPLNWSMASSMPMRHPRLLQALNLVGLCLAIGAVIARRL